jgi:hypothetical protein
MKLLGSRIKEVNPFWLNRVKKSPDDPIFEFNMSGVVLRGWKE